MMYMYQRSIGNTHHFFIFWQMLPTLVMKMIIINNYSYINICDGHTVDMLLPLNTIEDFPITRFVDVKRVHYNDATHLWTYHC
jgi:hypothetical protein